MLVPKRANYQYRNNISHLFYPEYRRIRGISITWHKQYYAKGVHRPWSHSYFDSYSCAKTSPEHNVHLPMCKTIPPICGSSLERLGFKRYHRQPDITTLLCFCWCFFFFRLTNTRTNTSPIPSKCHRRSGRSHGSAGTAPPPTEEESSSPVRTVAPRILAGMRFWRGVLRWPLPGRRT